ncbi:hypothetical protein DBR43_30760 [Pedobacter sp. KBW06]|nr:hypothetical protein DBR43_30760 [Pedobacter sp. KBW06]
MYQIQAQKTAKTYKNLLIHLFFSISGLVSMKFPVSCDKRAEKKPPGTQIGIIDVWGAGVYYPRPNPPSFRS